MTDRDRKAMAEQYKKRLAMGGVFAIKNSANGKRLIMAAADLKGSLNRFEFSQATGSCSFKKLEEDYKKFGPGAFSFEVLEEIEQKEGQSGRLFDEELKTLCAMLKEGEDADKLY